METKKEFRWFSIFQYEKEEAFLRDRHKAGWRFVKVTGLGVYHFERCEPEDVVYQLDYNQEGSAHKDDYVRLFADCGWEYLMEYAGYSYFRKPAAAMKGDEQIFCDDSSRLAMMKRVYRGRLMPLLFIFSACLLPQFASALANDNYLWAALFGGILLIYLVVFVTFAVQYIRFKRRIGR